MAFQQSKNIVVLLREQIQRGSLLAQQLPERRPDVQVDSVVAPPSTTHHFLLLFGWRHPFCEGEDIFIFLYSGKQREWPDVHCERVIAEATSDSSSGVVAVMALTL